MKYRHYAESPVFYLAAGTILRYNSDSFIKEQPMENRERSYRFAALADIHIDLEDGGAKTYFIHAETNFSRALEVIQARRCRLIVSAGDQVTNASGASAEWQRYRDLIRRSGYRGLTLEAMGNHESRYAKYGGCTVQDCREEFIRCTDLAEKPVIRPAGKTYYAYLDDVFGDVFLFLSLENGVDTNRIDNFSGEQLDWAEAQIEQFTREGRRIFLIQHTPVSGFGAGDDPAAPAYDGSLRLTDDTGKPFPNNRRFFDLICRYRQLIWLSGHTHVDFRDDFNCSDGNGRACHMLHIPALAGSTRIIKSSDGSQTLDRSFPGDCAQGYIAEVYENRVIFRGIDFLSDWFYPPYTYPIDR